MLCKSGVETSPKKLLPLTLFAIAVTSLFSVRPAQAFTMTLDQVGSNVVANGSGAINLTGLTLLSSGTTFAGVIPFAAAIAAGVPGGQHSLQYGNGITGPSIFGSGVRTLASSGTGNIVGMEFGAGFLDVPFGYHSGAALSDSMRFNNATFASLGLTPGTYEWTWGTGGANQEFILQIGPANVPDAGSTLPLLGCALLGLAALRRKLGC
jgi:VPDSG-CTERM motif